MNVERRRYFSLVELVNQKFSATLPYFNIEQKRKRKPDLNKLASLGATLVRNSAHLITDLITDRGKV